MIILLILFFIFFIVSFAYLFYKIKVLDNDIDVLYDNCFKYIESSFKRGDKNV